jgi:hypothetical protein
MMFFNYYFLHPPLYHRRFADLLQPTKKNICTQFCPVRPSGCSGGRRGEVFYYRVSFFNYFFPPWSYQIFFVQSIRTFTRNDIVYRLQVM